MKIEIKDPIYSYRKPGYPKNEKNRVFNFN